MRWPWKKKQDKVLLFEVPVGMLMRQTVYDSMIGDPEETADMLGFPPQSDDVSDMERSASEDRLDRVSVLMPVIKMQSGVVAQAAAMFQSEKAPKEFSEELVETVITAYTAVAFSAAVAVVSNLVDLKLLRLPGELDE